MDVEEICAKCLFVCFVECLVGEDLPFMEVTFICIIISAEPTESEKDLTKIKVSLLERNRNPHISSHLPLTPSSVFFSGIVGDIDKNNRTKTADKTKVIALPCYERVVFSVVLFCLFVCFYNLGQKGWKTSFYTHFALSHPCAVLTKHFHLTQVCIYHFFANKERGNRSTDIYSLGITVVFLRIFCAFCASTLLSSNKAK